MKQGGAYERAERRGEFLGGSFGCREGEGEELLFGDFGRESGRGKTAFVRERDGVFESGGREREEAAALRRASIAIEEFSVGGCRLERAREAAV